MKLYMVMSAIGVVIPFLQIFTGSIGIGSAVFNAILSGYFFLCVYSLYGSLKNEGSNKEVLKEVTRIV